MVKNQQIVDKSVPNVGKSVSNAKGRVLHILKIPLKRIRYPYEAMINGHEG